MSNAVKYKKKTQKKTTKNNHLHTVKHVVQSTFQNMLITFLSSNPTTLILSSLVSKFDSVSKSDFFWGWGGRGEGSGPPLLLQIFIKILWHNHIIIF